MTNNTILVSLVAVSLAACAPTTPRVDAAFGDSVRQASTAQTMFPDAGKDPNPVAGIDAQSGKLAVERYRDSFKAPPKTFEVINIGGAITGQ